MLMFTRFQKSVSTLDHVLVECRQKRVDKPKALSKYLLSAVDSRIFDLVSSLSLALSGERKDLFLQGDYYHGSKAIIALRG